MNQFQHSDFINTWCSWALSRRGAWKSGFPSWKTRISPWQLCNSILFICFVLGFFIVVFVLVGFCTTTGFDIIIIIIITLLWKHKQETRTWISCENMELSGDRPWSPASLPHFPLLGSYNFFPIIGFSQSSWEFFSPCQPELGSSNGGEEKGR